MNYQQKKSTTQTWLTFEKKQTQIGAMYDVKMVNIILHYTNT